MRDWNLTPPLTCAPLGDRQLESVELLPVALFVRLPESRLRAIDGELAVPDQLPLLTVRPLTLPHLDYPDDTRPL